MDETEFKTAYYEVNDRPCPFTKAILTRCCGCSRSQKVLIAEREAVTCKSPFGYERCRSFIGIMREKALFALRLTHLEDKLPHGKEIKVQCGSMLGLQAAMAPSAEARVEDINGTVEQALENWGEIERFPFSDVVKYVTSYEARKRPPKRR